MVKEFKDYSGDLSISCEVVVVGSGAGGAVAAKVLAEAGHDVVLVEEGSWFTRENFNGEPGDMIPMMYRDAASNIIFGLPPVLVTLGKCVGGTTTINSATCFRTPSDVVSTWRDKHGCSTLDYDELVPIFETVEKECSVTTLPPEHMSGSYHVVKRGAEALGIECKRLKHNVKGCEGRGVCQYGCPTGAKQSMDVSYIPAAINAGATMLANCKIEKIIVKEGAARGVAGRAIDPFSGVKGPNVEISARTVILACGALLTPALLMDNGLCTSSKMAGRNLTIHPAGKVAAVMDEDVVGFEGVSQDAYIDAFRDKGIMMEGVFVPPGLLLSIFQGIGREHKEMARKYRRMAAFGFLVSDLPKGRVFKGRMGRRYTAVYNLSREDARKMKEGVVKCVEIFLAAGSKEIYTGLRSVPVIRSEGELDTLRKKRIHAVDFSEPLAFHPLGTCRLGPDPAVSVLDQNLETHEVKNLFIVDGSIFPTSLGVNPMISIMTFAHRAASYIHSNAARYL